MSAVGSAMSLELDRIHILEQTGSLHLNHYIDSEVLGSLVGIPRE